MLFRRTPVAPVERHSWVAWVVAVGLTVILFLSVGLQAGALRPGEFARGAAPPQEQVRQERLTFQTLPPLAPEAQRAAPPASQRIAPRARPVQRQPVRTPTTALQRSRAAADSAGSARATERPLTSTPKSIMSPDMRLTLPAISAPSRGTNAAPTCSAPCVAGVRAGASAPEHTLTAAERDSVFQAMNRDAQAAAAAGGGGSQNTGGMGGISIPVGLPGGGPSRAQRKRDSTVNAHTLPILERLRQRADSVLAARRRDSLKAIAKQQRDSISGHDSTSARDSTSGLPHQL